ncbi:alpha/beta hydrolase [Amycolatopsis balhimycina DSM 5908]|uniref:Alpha/beta hydrolase n=1 Tax=Amycolatopsis balhimycina DSM 5908 TaxID=1081091 RepID=A0A428WRZ3_AMYBA|nr:alpha/beta hydrolase [Amycolatopsis balhimycina DSM 5908]
MLLVLVLGFAVALGGYVGYVAIRAAQPVTLPAPTGAYPVGRTIIGWTDHTRTDSLAPQPGTPRELSVWLWYPAAPGPDAQPAPYTPGAWSGLHLGGVPGLGETGFDEVHDHALADVPVAGGRFPIAVLAPGLGLAAPQYTTIAENLASHGYLVTGVTPTYSANLTVLNGQTVSATDAGNPPVFDATDLHAGPAQAAGDRLVGIWAADDRFAAAHVAALDSSGRFAGHVDATTTVYLGHSFGGAAALEACSSDPHCAGAADLDGTQYGTVVHTGLTKPMLLVGSENSCITGICQPADAGDQADRDTARVLLAATTGPTWCYRINGAEHFNFSDYGTYYLAAPIRTQLALGPINGAEALTITGAYLTAFADHVTRGRPEPLLTGPPPYPQVDVQRIAS